MFLVLWSQTPLTSHRSSARPRRLSAPHSAQNRNGTNQRRRCILHFAESITAKLVVWLHTPGATNDLRSLLLNASVYSRTVCRDRHHAVRMRKWRSGTGKSLTQTEFTSGFTFHLQHSTSFFTTACTLYTPDSS